MASFTAARSILRSSTTARSTFSRFSKPKSNPFSKSFNFPKQNTLNAPRILRSPVELSCCVESLMPYHTATASSLLNSMLSAPRCAGWTPEGKDQTR